MEKMTIHRALAELKLMGSKINCAIGQQFVLCKSNSQNKINGRQITEVERELQGNLDSAMALIERRNKIKKAIILSNANTKITVGDTTMTVAEAIDYKDAVQYENALLSELSRQYSQSTGKCNKENELLQTKFETFFANSGKNEVSVEEKENDRQMYFKNNEFSLVDPNKVKNRIDTLNDKTTMFLMEIDAVLSESNATTFIEF